MDINKWLKNHPVYRKYGAPLGDRGEQGDPDRSYKFYLQRIRMVGGDYDPAGTYWGGGRSTPPLYGFMVDDDEDGLVRGFVRATSRDGAKSVIHEEYPNARFYR
jgi:hypothetical protein